MCTDSASTSAGGDTVLAEKSGVRIARTPYRIQFFRMPGFFKPGMPFSIRVHAWLGPGYPELGFPACGSTRPHACGQGAVCGCS